MSGIVEIDNLHLMLAYFFVVILIVLVQMKKIPVCKDIIVGVIRMTIQLLIVGYILEYIFKIRNPFLVILVLAVMMFFAVTNIIKRIKFKVNRKVCRSIILSMCTAPVVCLILFLMIVVDVRPLYEPSYIIPLAGMIFGNSMTALSLCVRRFLEGIQEEKHYIENALSLGASPKKAIRNINHKAITSAIMPTINNMVTMGVVSLPGMMTGQVLSGTSPLIATRYQIAIMLVISCSAALSAVIFTLFSYRTFFNKECQLDFDVIEGENGRKIK